jgi:hypothetical protein
VCGLRYEFGITGNLVVQGAILFATHSTGAFKLPVDGEIDAMDREHQDVRREKDDTGVIGDCQVGLCVTERSNDVRDSQECR